jgi:large subunit ribosomal protein L4
MCKTANRRQFLANTKDKSEVRGGGRKPWRQKGTGRARQGSNRSPLWRGGGITFGPTKFRNFARKINARVKKQALQMVLSNKLATEHLIVVDKIEISEGKTKNLNAILSKLVGSDKKLVLALAQKDELIIQASYNLQNVRTLPADSLNVLELLRAPYLVMTEAAVDKVTKLYQ